jgi:hypothetical protein
MYVIEVAVQEGEVDMDAELGLRNVSGFAGIKGPAFLVGEVGDGCFVGDFDPDEIGLGVDCDPSCSHCLSRSATLPVLVVPLVPRGLAGEPAWWTSDVEDEIATVGFRTGSGGCVFWVGRTGVTKPAGGGPSISTDTLG